MSEPKNRSKPIPLSLPPKYPPPSGRENHTTSKSCCQASKNGQFPPLPSVNPTINPAPDKVGQDAQPSQPNYHLKIPSASLPSAHSQHATNPSPLTHLTVPYCRPQPRFPAHLQPQQTTSIPNFANTNNTTNAAITTTMPANILHRPPIQRANGALPLPKLHPHPPPHYDHHQRIQPPSLPAVSTATPLPQSSSHAQPDQIPNSAKLTTPPQSLNPNPPTITLTAPPSGPNESEVHHQSQHRPNADDNNNPLPTFERLLLVLFYLVVLIHAGLAVSKVMGVIARVVGVVWIGVVVGRWFI